jgi:hypothetical protein
VITVTRNQVRRFRSVFRRSVLGVAHKGPIAAIVFQADGPILRTRFQYRDLAVEHVEESTSSSSEWVALPVDVLADFEGAADSAVTLDTIGLNRSIVCWQDHGIPQVREYDVPPTDRNAVMPKLPAMWVSNPPDLLTALAEATETSTDDAARYALYCIQLQGSGNQVIATDGHQLLFRGGFTFPWTSDVLIKGIPLFGCRSLPRDEPVDIGITDTHVVLRVGPWTIWLQIQKEARFPNVGQIVPYVDQATTRLILDPEDVRFVESRLDRLPGKDAIHSPVTLELNGKVALRSRAEGQTQATELVLSRSRYTGSPIKLSTNRTLLGRALRMGFREVAIPGADIPLVCRDRNITYAWQPLTNAVVESGNDVVCIQSGSTTAVASHVPPARETSRSTMREPIARNGHRPAEPVTTSSRPAVTIPMPIVSVSRIGDDGSTGNLASLIQEAKALHTASAEFRARSARLVAGLRRHRKQSRLLNETLKSLRQIRLRDVTP